MVGRKTHSGISTDTESYNLLFAIQPSPAFCRHSIAPAGLIDTEITGCRERKHLKMSHGRKSCISILFP